MLEQTVPQFVMHFPIMQIALVLQNFKPRLRNHGCDIQLETILLQCANVCLYGNVYFVFVIPR